MVYLPHGYSKLSSTGTGSGYKCWYPSFQTVNLDGGSGGITTGGGINATGTAGAAGGLIDIDSAGDVVIGSTLTTSGGTAAGAGQNAGNIDIAQQVLQQLLLRQMQI